MSDLENRYVADVIADYKKGLTIPRANCDVPMLLDEIERLTALADQIRTDWIPANRQLKARIDELEGAIKTAKGFIGPADGTMDAWIILSKALEGEVK